MVEDTDYIRVVVGSIPCAAIRGWYLRKMVCEYDKNIMEYLYQKKDTESHEDSDFFYKTVIGRSQSTSAFAEVLFIWLQSS